MTMVDKKVFILILRHKQLEAIKLKTQNYWFHQKDTPMDLVEIEIQVKIMNGDASEEWIEKLMYR